MPDNNFTAVFDGVTDVARLPGQGSVSWDVVNGFMGYYSAYNSTVDDFLTATANLTGNNWTVAAMRFGAGFDNKTIL